MKSVDIHPDYPWILAAMYSGNVTIYDYEKQVKIHIFLDFCLILNRRQRRISSFQIAQFDVLNSLSRSSFSSLVPMTSKSESTTTIRWRKFRVLRLIKTL